MWRRQRPARTSPYFFLPTVDFISELRLSHASAVIGVCAHRVLWGTFRAILRHARGLRVPRGRGRPGQLVQTVLPNPKGIRFSWFLGNESWGPAPLDVRARYRMHAVLATERDTSKRAQARSGSARPLPIQGGVPDGRRPRWLLHTYTPTRALEAPEGCALPLMAVGPRRSAVRLLPRDTRI